MITLFLFALLCIFLTAKIFRRQRSLIEAPVMVSLLAFAWMIPQGFAINLDISLQYLSQNLFWGYATLCLIAFTIGFRSKRSFRKSMAESARPHYMYSLRRLKIASFVMILVGFSAYRAAGAIAEAQNLSSQWTGPATFVFMFGQFLNWGFAIATLIFFRHRTPQNFALFSLGLALVLFQMSGYVKRNAAFEITFILIGGAVLVRNWRPNLVFVAVAAFAGTFLIHEVGAIRNYASLNKVSSFQAVFSEAALSPLGSRDTVSTTEFQQAISDVSMSQKALFFDLGANYWNKFVHRWVPAFILGRDFKNSLALDTLVNQPDGQVINFRGASRTGFSDSFRAFWFFGVAVFMFIGWFVGRFYHRALRGDIFEQYLYLILLKNVLVAFTDSTARFLVDLPWVFIIAYLVFFVFSRIRKLASTSDDAQYLDEKGIARGGLSPRVRKGAHV